jgi:hypothetical protein
MNVCGYFLRSAWGELFLDERIIGEAEKPETYVTRPILSLLPVEIKRLVVGV